MIGLFEHIVIKADQNKTILNQQQLDFLLNHQKQNYLKKLIQLRIFYIIEF